MGLWMGNGISPRFFAVLRGTVEHERLNPLIFWRKFCFLSISLYLILLANTDASKQASNVFPSTPPC